MSTIGTNVGSLNASFFLTVNNEALTRSIKKLSAGSRLADPTEDAAGVAVSGRLDANVLRLVAAVDGAQNMVSFAQTTDGFLSTIQQQLTRMSELAQRATNGAFGSADRANYNVEFQTLKTQIDSISSNASFNGTSLFTASSITVAINASGASDTFSTKAISLSLSSTSIGTTSDATSAITAISSALATVTTRRAEVNSDISKFNFHITNIRTERINLESANSRIKDLDVAAESSNLAKNNILLQASTAMLAQANASQQAVLALLQ